MISTPTSEETVHARILSPSHEPNTATFVRTSDVASSMIVFLIELKGSRLWAIETKVSEPTLVRVKSRLYSGGPGVFRIYGLGIGGVPRLTAECNTLKTLNTHFTLTHPID